ncbi:P-loop containing nucleoside triphosphate hydrolase protein [Microstroma glucosiphilum]|uniref:P-loop containing nucleoside triphosphate hydrolase protein n=1 Tax=Pseudomicrostroma glucosiphilum TaxID=1684307 RepID=A0A316UCC6_9BASI|nr:P-loop containing nucleoside triphosphate hydrolase protein [Pseudomicrostroma glucosiphilum]PWN22802.1 P-loop containing nucleoside triphosphate hydrolase protein [Pseudomicrostroma glucosiphilum]
MDAAVDALADGLIQTLASLNPDERYLVGISGIPGSGKSTLATHVCQTVNAKLDGGGNGSSTSPIAAIVGMDGWHYTRARLATFPNPTEAKDRRGAAFTFDAASFSDFVTLLKTRPQEVVKAPSFDHSLKDPVEEDVEVRPAHRIVIIEGLYCNCDDGEWGRGAKLLDERWVVEVQREVARQRLRVRHVETGVAKDEEEALWRADNNDLPNGDYLLSHLLEPVKRIKSREEEAWATS